MPYADPQKRIEYLRQWRKNNPDKSKESVKKWKENNRDHKRRIDRKWMNWPWVKTYKAIRARCTNPRHEMYRFYGAKGIRCLITPNELRELWFRDKAMNLERPSIDRIDPHKDYTKENCRYIELRENIERSKYFLRAA